MKYHIKELEEQAGENRLYGTNISQDVQISRRERGTHRTLSSPQKQKVQKNVLKGISLLPDSKRQQGLSQG